jgi:predicted RNase H-like HicB family nuclease
MKHGGRMNLRVVVERDEKGYYVAEVPALPGCVSQGKTYEEALANIKEAVEGWLEVMESKHSFDPKQAVAVSV